MSKIAFKNPKGDTIYWAKIGFDWGAFWSLNLLAGLPFFLRKMNMLGAYCLVLALMEIIGIGLEEEYTILYAVIVMVPNLALGIYFGIRGGTWTARHYLEEGYTFHTKDTALLALAKTNWNLEG